MNSEDIRFSVIIPAYNAGKTIVRAIESALEQTHAPYEIIVINDTSSDNTGELIESFGERVKHIQLLQNCGSAVARNKGLDAASGDYIAFLDADDLWHEQKLELVASILSAKPDISFLYHSYTLQDIRTITSPQGAVLYQTPFVKFLTRNPVATPCAVITNSKEFRFEPSMRYMEDYDLWLRIAYKHKAYFIDIPLTQIGRPVLSEGGISENKWEMRKGELRAFRRLVRLNPLFLPMLPFLYTYSLGKHLYKTVSGN
ncbi:glycosyltransferase family 2 protein [Polluticoccus soli]|uniref:glycosyltransferase family 2 protein n=1 Tax=Polluticoccus soli TaxID=3034150 RepID=UPI0023E0F426|nr:glycosyltransferase family A protein [Flavipsychrobacter sp. JY13-12]